MNPLISVIIPLYNKETIVSRTIQSVLSQSFRDFELIIVNDGSTDSSMDVVRTIHDDRIVILEQENGGPSKARNTGIKNAKGNWIVFLDADDELTGDALGIMIRETNRYSNADIIDFGGYIRSGNNLTLRYHPLKGKVKNALKVFFFRKISPGCGHSIFRAEFAKRYLYDERLRRYEDCELLLRMLPNANVFSSQDITEIHDVNYAEASNVCKNIDDDFTGHLEMKKGGFWYKMCVFQLFLFERNNYVKQCHQLYSSWYYRYDLLLLLKLLNVFCR